MKKEAKIEQPRGLVGLCGKRRSSRVAKKLPQGKRTALRNKKHLKNNIRTLKACVCYKYCSKVIFRD